MLEIRTNELSSRKSVLIDGHGYKVRRLGAGEELTLNQTIRRLEALDKKEKANQLTEKEAEEVMKHGQNMLDIMASCFDDGMGGVKSKALVQSLSGNDLKAIHDKIFAQENSGT